MFKKITFEELAFIVLAKSVIDLAVTLDALLQLIISPDMQDYMIRLSSY